jgi:hypothetical protein
VAGRRSKGIAANERARDKAWGARREREDAINEATAIVRADAHVSSSTR